MSSVTVDSLIESLLRVLLGVNASNEFSFSVSENGCEKGYLVQIIRKKNWQKVNRTCLVLPGTLQKPELKRIKLIISQILIALNYQPALNKRTRFKIEEIIRE